jgi:hypothetical protein
MVPFNLFPTPLMQATKTLMPSEAGQVHFVFGEHSAPRQAASLTDCHSVPSSLPELFSIPAAAWSEHHVAVVFDFCFDPWMTKNLTENRGLFLVILLKSQKKICRISIDWGWVYSKTQQSEMILCLILKNFTKNV